MKDGNSVGLSNSNVKSRYLSGNRSLLAITALAVAITFAPNLSPMARASEVTSQETTAARQLQMEGTRLQLQGNVEGAIKKYKESLGLQPNEKLDTLLKKLEKQVGQGSAPDAAPIQAADPSAQPPKTGEQASAPTTNAEQPPLTEPNVAVPSGGEIVKPAAPATTEIFPIVAKPQSSSAPSSPGTEAPKPVDHVIPAGQAPAAAVTPQPPPPTEPNVAPPSESDSAKPVAPATKETLPVVSEPQVPSAPFMPTTEIPKPVDQAIPAEQVPADAVTPQPQPVDPNVAAPPGGKNIESEAPLGGEPLAGPSDPKASSTPSDPQPLTEPTLGNASQPAVNPSNTSKEDNGIAK